MSLRRALLPFAATLVACTGVIGNAGDDVGGGSSRQSVPVIDDTCVPSSTRVRVVMLSQAQIDNTIAAYFGTTSVTAETAAAELAHMSCTPQTEPASSPADTCITAYIATRGAQLFHRPLTDVEIDSLYNDYLSGFHNPHDANAAVAGLNLTISAMLQSPQFLSRTERGDGGVGVGGTTQLTSYEIAAAIAYTIIDGPPDAELATHASADDFNVATIRSEVTRLLATDAGHTMITRFVMEWLGLSAPTAVADTALTSEIAQAMLSETQLTITDVLFTGTGTLNELLTVPYTFVNKPLADFYGYVGPSGDAFEKLSVEKRPGILAHGSFLATNALPPITLMHRGNVARTALFCESLPTFESLGLSADFTPPELTSEPAPGQTRRQQIEDQDGDTAGTPSCLGCHQFFVPIGTAFESFDDYGRVRSSDNGSPVDPSGTIIDTMYVDPSTGQILDAFDGLSKVDFPDYPGLTRALASDARVEACAAQAIFTFASGRSDITSNNCDVRAFQADVAQSGEGIVEAFIDYMSSSYLTQRVQ